jgi:hypothetical protein
MAPMIPSDDKREGKADESSGVGQEKSAASNQSASTKNEDDDDDDDVPNAKNHSRVVPTPPPPHKRPKKATHFGKADPVRDSILFVAFLTFMFGVSYLSKSVVLNNDNNDSTKKLPSLSDVRQMKMSLQYALEESQKSGFEPDIECSVMLGMSSLPHSGWGLFSGKNFRVGDDILGATQINMMKMNIKMNMKMPASWLVNANHKNRHPYALLVQPHSLLANAQWDLEVDMDVKSSAAAAAAAATTDDDGALLFPIVPKLVATKYIAPGDEIFVAWEDHYLYQHHPHLFPNTPTPNHFHRTDEIIQEAREIFKLNTGASIRRTRIPEINKALKMVKRTLFRYDAIVARLVPMTLDELLLYPNKTFTSELIAVKKKNNKLPLQTLVSHCRCLTNVKWRRRRVESESSESSESNNDDKNTGEQGEQQTTNNAMTYQQVLSKDYVEKGDLIMPIPLLLHPMMDTEDDDEDDDDEMQPPSSNNNSEQEQETHQSCPNDLPLAVENNNNNNNNSNNKKKKMLPAYLAHSCIPLRNANGERLGLGLCPVTSMMHITTNPEEANAKIQWSVKSQLHQQLLSDLLHTPTSTREGILQEEEDDDDTRIETNMLTMSWDVVALQEINQNETITVLVDDDLIGRIMRWW